MHAVSRRRSWSTTVDAVGTWNRSRHESRAAAYRWVDARRADYRSGALRGTRVTVWVDEGDDRGWRTYERFDFAEGADCA